jgi:hypothetical protein
MAYAIIQPPFTLDFRNMSKKELRAYAEWFHHVLPERVAELTNAVKGTRGYESWDPNLTPESLGVLGRWFEGQVEARAKTGEEMGETNARLTFPIDVPNEELTNKDVLARDGHRHVLRAGRLEEPGRDPVEPATREQEVRGPRPAGDHGVRCGAAEPGACPRLHRLRDLAAETRRATRALRYLGWHEDEVNRRRDA